jgi:hypothetical protein
MSSEDDNDIIEELSDHGTNLESETNSETDREHLEDLMKIDYTYPEPNDKEIQYKLYKKREFYYHKMPPRPDVQDYNDMKEYRDTICDREPALYEHQALLSNFVNPDTPYNVLIYHGTGSGKTCAAVAIGEKFKQMVQKYNTKIYVLVSGPLLKENWKNHLLKCTGETYLKYQDKSIYIDEAEKNKLKKNALNQALQYYRFMSYRSFYKRVLGEKIVEKKIVKGAKVRVSYRKTDEGEFERDIAVDRLYNLNNSLIIVDEAHSLTGNAYGDALKQIIQNSTNLRVVLLTATPMKNLADDIIELLNFLRPLNSQIERDKVFNSHKNHLMDFKEGGLQYLKNMARGYVSHLRGADPLTYAKRLDMGIKPPELLFTKVVPCRMHAFQRKIYDEAVREQDDTLDRRSEAVANFVFPGLSQDRKELTGYYGREGIGIVKNQLKTQYSQINKKIANEIIGNDDEADLIYLTENGRTVTGKMLHISNLKYFSTKFYTALKKLNRLVYGKKGPKTAFVYSNLVKVGIELFQEILLQNGYLEFDEVATNYVIKPTTICALCGKEYKDHPQISEMSRYDRKKIRKDDEIDDLLADVNKSLDDEDVFQIIQDGGKQGQSQNQDSDDQDSDDDNDTSTLGYNSDSESDNESDTNKSEKVGKINKSNFGKYTIKDKKASESSTEYDNKEGNRKIPVHKFSPATFISVTGKTSEESAEFIPEDKQRILDNVFSSLENKNGRLIKFVLGSKVMNEGISLKHVSEVHILDVYFNLGKVDQIIGRAIRHCSHYKLMNEENIYPLVKVYKYTVTLEKGLSSEEELYQKAELKYLLTKKVERAMKEVAIDCPLNMYGNMFKEEMDQFANCGEPGKEPCPAICDYTKCSYKCDDIKLNAEFFDPERNLYKKIPKDQLDYSTFTHSLARMEIDYAKKKIKEMYNKKHVHTLNNVIAYVKGSYNDEKRELFDPFFVYKALDELIPLTENDFNNFKDTILDKYNHPGYLIYINNYYIFQPFDQNEDVPMYYRTTYDKPINQQLSLYNYLRNTDEYKKYKGERSKKIVDEEGMTTFKDVQTYDFDSVMEYYDSRDEHNYVGIIDKEVSRRKNKQPDEIKDVFKIRDKRAKILDKKRGTGIPSFKGAVCSTSKNKEHLESIAKELGITFKNEDTRTLICDVLRDKMLLLEKYSTTKDKNKFTYVMIPANHPQFPFPYNLEDRIQHIINKIKMEINFKLNIATKTLRKSNGPEKGLASYKIIIKDDPKLKEFITFLGGLGATKTGQEWIIDVE